MANNVEQELVLPGGGGGSGSAPSDPINYRADNYSGIVALATNPQLNELAYARSSEGTRWLPGSLGGTFFPAGLYYYDGASWVSDREAIAEQLQINVDDVDQLELDVAANDADIAALQSGLSAETAARIAADANLQSQINGLGGGVQSVTGALVDNTDPANPVVNPLTYVEESTIIAGDASGVWVVRALGAQYANKDVEMKVYRSTGNTTETMGVREVGSAVPKFFPIRRSTTHFEVKADANGDIEIISTTLDTVFEVTGTKPTQ